MPRKQFIADVNSAADSSIPDIADITRGQEDGDVEFLYLPADAEPIKIRALATSVSEYPSGNVFILCTTSEDLPRAVTTAVEVVAAFSSGMTINQLISATSSALKGALATSPGTQPSEPHQMIEEFDTAEESDDDQDSSFDDLWCLDTEAEATNHSRACGFTSDAVKMLNKRIRQDVRIAKQAGCKIGILGGMTADVNSSLLCLSIQVSRLGLSDEAIQAWDLRHGQYIVLLIKYSNGYRTFDHVIQAPSGTVHGIQMRIGVCNRYKPNSQSANAAFATLSKHNLQDERHHGVPNLSQALDTSSEFDNIFISSSLNEHMNKNFIPLLIVRSSSKVGWDNAKRLLDSFQGRFGESTSNIPLESMDGSTSVNGPQLSCHSRTGIDHLDDPSCKVRSFPLLAMQFAVEKVTHCTEYCLNCYERTAAEFQAIKPYVCSKPLCLWQYMRLGFGPSIEHEIMTQPYVVDLLISFCYASAQSRRLRDYPVGMGLTVPSNLKTFLGNRIASATFVGSGVYAPSLETQGLDAKTSKGRGFSVKYDSEINEVTLSPGDDRMDPPLHAGDWIVLAIEDLGYILHLRVLSYCHPRIILSGEGIGPSSHSPPGLPNDKLPVQATEPHNTVASTNGHTPVSKPVNNGISVELPNTTQATTLRQSLNGKVVEADMTLYDGNFDNFNDVEKCDCIVTILNTMPTVMRMRRWIKNQHSAEAKLSAWNDGITPAALGLLRWIISSNRSFIMQIDKCPGQEDSDEIRKRQDQKITNMDGWIQFRFAQGAPDKERRFNTALENEDVNDPPTIFAWHGSRLANWHSIIRTGLDFLEPLNGRAYGHGVYHSQDLNTSLGYSSNHHGYTQNASATWAGSEIEIRQAICLNEIVNKPEKFVSSNPHLVVQHVDWIQCRYLFVKTNADDPAAAALRKSDHANLMIQQDERFHVRGSDGKPVEIPLGVLPASRGFRSKGQSRNENTPDVKKLKIDQSPSCVISDAINDQETDDEDLIFLCSDDEEEVFGDPHSQRKRDKRTSAKRKSQHESPLSETDFVPGSLDLSNLPMLVPPKYASTSTSKILQRELKGLLKVQETTRLNELGWYIDQNLIENIYQWIVELHSFDPKIPLAKDMKAAGVTSVILEIRFGNQYPISPPFVRVIRPRFLPFMQGGGGHVTAGGAMCMELLTNSGWSAVSSIESVLLQVRVAMMNLEPRPARILPYGQQRDYGVGEAMDAFIRACKTHGWDVPKDFSEFAISSA